MKFEKNDDFSVVEGMNGKDAGFNWDKDSLPEKAKTTSPVIKGLKEELKAERAVFEKIEAKPAPPAVKKKAKRLIVKERIPVAVMKKARDALMVEENKKAADM